MFGFLRIEISTNPKTAGEVEAGHEISDENIRFLDKLHVKEVAERIHVEHRHHFWIDAGEERERRRHVRTEHRAVVLLHSLGEEILRPLQPEILQPIRQRPYHRPTVAARNRRPLRGGGRGLRLRQRERCIHHLWTSFYFFEFDEEIL